MAEETVDAAIKACDLTPKSACVTTGLFLEGGHNWTPTSFIRLVQDYGLETEVAIHLSNTYGDQAEKVAEMSSLTGKRWPVTGVRLHQEFPYLEAEVKYAVKEYARTAIDVVARRTRMSFLNVLAADEALPSENNLFFVQDDIFHHFIIVLHTADKIIRMPCFDCVKKNSR
jgi:glycerol-3-phosphate dehydrogenase